MAVYRDFDQDTLEKEYNARDTVSAAEFEAVIARYAEDSARAREALDCRTDLRYGRSSDEVLDLFPAGHGAPLFVWVHGGYWRMLSQKESAFMAPCFGSRGAAVAAVNYALAPAASLDEIVAQCRRSIAWLHGHAADYGIDRDRIFIGGSSAGGHLVGMLIAAGWHGAFGVPENVVKGCLALSGLYDLEPLLHCLPNSWLHLDEAAAHRNSPIRWIPERGGCPLVVSYGGNETAEFKRQTDDFADAWAARGFPVTRVPMDETNHFDIVLDLCEDGGRLTRAVFEMMGI